MATATLTETPEEILDWMKKFGFDARSMKQKDKDDTKKLAEDVGRLLNELQSLPDFKDLLKRFGEIAETWKWGAGLLQQYKAGGAESDHETRVALRKGMKEALAALKLLKIELDAAQKTPTVDDASDELRRAAGTVTINRSLIEDKVKDGGPGDQLAAKSLERRAADATKLAESLVERGETDEEEGRRGPHRKLAVATLRVVANDQQVFLSSLQNDSSGAGPETPSARNCRTHLGHRKQYRICSQAAAPRRRARQNQRVRSRLHRGPPRRPEARVRGEDGRDPRRPEDARRVGRAVARPDEQPSRGPASRGSGPHGAGRVRQSLRNGEQPPEGD